MDRPSAPGHVDAWEEFWIWWSIAWPIGITKLCGFAMSVSDMAVLGRVSTDALAGAALGALVTSWAAVLLNSFPSAVLTLAAQAIGRGNGRLAGLWAQSGFFWAMVFALPVVVAWLFSSRILWAAGFRDGNEASLAGTFASVLALSVPARFASAIATAYFRSMQVVKPAMFAGLVMVGINLGLSILLVHGAGSFQGLGFVGAPIATTISAYLSLGLMLGWNVWIKRYHTAYWPRSGWRALIREGLSRQRINDFLVGQALPLVASQLLEEAQLQTLTALAAGLGQASLGASQSMFEVFFLATSFTYGLVGAAITRMGHHLGAGRVADAKRVMWLQLGACALLGVVIATVIISTRSVLGRVFSSDPDVLEAVESIAWIVGCGYSFMSLFYWSMSVLIAQGRSGWVAGAFVLGAWVVGVPSSYIAVKVFDGGLRGLWLGATAGYTVTTLVAMVGVWRSDWPALAAEAQRKAEDLAEGPLAGGGGAGYEMAGVEEEEDDDDEHGGGAATFHIGDDGDEEATGGLLPKSPGAGDRALLVAAEEAEEEADEEQVSLT